VRRVLWAVGLALCLLVAVVVLALAAGAHLGPVANVWPVRGAQLVLLAVLSLVPPVVRLWWRPRPWAVAVAAVAVLAVGYSGIVTGQIVGAARAGGGSVNLLGALWLSSMDAPADARETYAVAGGQPLSAVVYRPKPGPAPVPVIMFIHGGGWIAGRAGELEYDLRWFADRGWLAISVDYRLATASEPTWDTAPRDVACALVWVRANAARLGGDPDRLAVAGDSAGGNLAVNLAYAAAQGRARSGCGGPVPVPRAVLVQYPVVDPQDAYDHGRAAAFTERYLGGPPSRYPDRLRAISSATYLSAAAPPTLIVEPDADRLVPTAGVLRFADLARAAGVDVTVCRIPYAGHGFDQLAAGSPGNRASLTIRAHYLRAHGL
jgi:acetyl esterase/lipase